MSADEAKTAVACLIACLALFALGFHMGGGEPEARDCTCHCDCSGDPR